MHVVVFRASRYSLQRYKFTYNNYMLELKTVNTGVGQANMMEGTSWAYPALPFSLVKPFPQALAHGLRTGCV
jgi:hypothetical protein